MALPAHTIPTPEIVDTLQSYSVGTHIGVDEGTDVWDATHAAGGAGALVQMSGHLMAAAGNAAQAKVVGFAGGALIRRSNLPQDQYAIAQCVVPMGDDFGPGTYPAVRCNPSTGDCYYLLNMGDEIAGGMHLALYARVGGVAHGIANWYTGDGGTNNLIIDGYWVSDGFVAMLEAYGTNPVTLRASAMLPTPTWGEVGRYPAAQNGNEVASAITAYPGGIPNGVSGTPAKRILGTVTDATYKLTGGQPGIVSNGIDINGGLANWAAGTLYSLTASAGPVSNGSAVISGTRVPGSTVVVT